MADLPDELHEQIKKLCAEGDKLVDEERFDQALTRYQSAWDLLPEPQTDWKAASWILAAMGDARFFPWRFCWLFRGLYDIAQDVRRVARQSLHPATSRPVLV